MRYSLPFSFFPSEYIFFFFHLFFFFFFQKDFFSVDTRCAWISAVRHGLMALDWILRVSEAI